MMSADPEMNDLVAKLAQKMKIGAVPKATEADVSEILAEQNRNRRFTPPPEPHHPITADDIDRVESGK